MMNSSLGEELKNLSDTSIAFQSIFIFLLIAMSCYSNGNVLLLMIKDELMRTATNTIVAIQSLADLFLCVFVLPFSLVTLIMRDWEFGAEFCAIQAVIQRTILRVSSPNLLILVVIKYFYIVKRRFQRPDRRVEAAVVGAIFIVSLTFSLPWPWQTTYFLAGFNSCVITTKNPSFSEAVFASADLVFLYITPLTTTFVLFFLTHKAVHKKNAVAPESLSNEDKIATQMYYKSAPAYVTVLSCYVIFSLPLVTVTMALSWVDISTSVLMFAQMMFWLNCAVKPLLYAEGYEKLVKFLKQLPCGKSIPQKDAENSIQ